MSRTESAHSEPARRGGRRLVYAAIPIAVVVLALGGFLGMRGEEADAAGEPQARSTTATVVRREFVRSIRLNGTVEAVEATTVAAPRIAGPGNNSLLITSLIKGGTKVVPGDLLVVFDRQVQLQTAFDRRAELHDLDQQIRRKEAEQRAAEARDDSELQLARSAIQRAKLEIVKNEMLPKIQAEKNLQALEQAEARLKELKITYELKRRAAEADLAVLRIRRAKAENAMNQAEANANRMEVRSPISGLAVIRTTWKSGGMAEILEGEEVRPGMPIVDVVNPDKMRVRSRVNQVDINELRSGQPVRIGLDAYPELSFPGRVGPISPLGVTSSLSPKVRQFLALVDVEGSHPNLMPDLTASLDVELERVAGALVVPRDSVRFEGGKAFVRAQSGGGFSEREIQAGPRSATEVVVTSGLDEGAVVARAAAARSARR
jgi:multidrug efflux pump subunit AcrA (membrane-fusion protein)